MSKKDLSTQCAYYFIDLMHEANATQMSIKLENVTRRGKKIGSYELVVKKLKDN